MSDLETVLRELADAGKLSHISILSSGSGFHASFAAASSWGRGMAWHKTDPVVAALEAISKAPKSAPEKKRTQPPVVHPPVPSTPRRVKMAGAAPQASAPARDKPGDKSTAPRLDKWIE
jgi:hypothetical protein